MCRIMLGSADKPFAIAPLLQSFAAISRDSREYQGHGWGCSWQTDAGWQHYHCIDPVWTDDLMQFGETRLLLAHARSAFRDEGIVVENNMPFSDGDSVFIFNGELRGVRIKSEGRIGAEKIYNYIRRMDKGDLLAALEKGVNIISHRSQYVRAMNILMSDGKRHLLSSNYNEDTEYFQMHRTVRDGVLVVCSDPFHNETDWQPIANHTTLQLQ
jgi:glutamine amidotransferase